MNGGRAAVAGLLVGSGLCALVYQIAWLRLLRTVFGSSTAATAAVLAIFMGGIGWGSHRLGERADRVDRPLALYARLEIGIALLAAISPWMVALARWVYLGAGGVLKLGWVGATVLQLVLATVVLGPATFLMGGTLPAAVRSATGSLDAGRRSVGLLYAANSLGAVVGAFATTFWAIEELGVRRTILAAAAVNLGVAAVAVWWAGRREPVGDPTSPPSPQPTVPSLPGPIVLVAAGLVGFVFFGQEMVWYRMLAPLLGGSTYTFGLILAVALAGIALGGLLYAAKAEGQGPSPTGLPATCAIEAGFVLIPLALGDRLAYLADLLRGLDVFGFGGLVVAWTIVAVAVVLPTSVVAGYQFPLLIALLGEGRERVGRDVGLAYAANTAGAIVGSVSVGFLLMPLLGAVGMWRLNAGCLLGLGLVALGWSRRRWLAVVPIGLVVPLLIAPGPGAVWRHGEIGAGRFEANLQGPNDMLRARAAANRDVVWERDGREASVAIRSARGYSFSLNGKSDGHARWDAPTQVMSTILGAALHGGARHGLVIGLGTGSSAGWLAEVPTVERVDVFEIEPSIEEMARRSGPVNAGVLDSPKVHVTVGDARELLLTVDERYDIIFSEPSNPYRAGVSSLFTKEFYEGAAARLPQDGLFVQWLQAYEVDARVIESVYATLGSAFAEVESWEVHSGDLLLVASQLPIRYDSVALRARVAREPFRSAMEATWGVWDLEGFLSAHVGNGDLARTITSRGGIPINTDDHPVVEFGFARNLGRFGRFSIHELRELARTAGSDRPVGLDRAGVDWDLVDDLVVARGAFLEEMPPLPPGGRAGREERATARLAYLKGSTRRAAEIWFRQPEPPVSRFDLLLVAEGLAEAGDEGASAVVVALEELEPVEAGVVRARLEARRGRFAQAARELAAAFEAYRDDPWPWPAVMLRALSLAEELARWHPPAARQLLRSLDEPFALSMWEARRLEVVGELIELVDFETSCGRYYERFEPYPEWAERFLERRAACYEAVGHELAARAGVDLQTFRDRAAVRTLGELVDEAED